MDCPVAKPAYQRLPDIINLIHMENHEEEFWVRGEELVEKVRQQQGAGSHGGQPEDRGCEK